MWRDRADRVVFSRNRCFPNCRMRGGTNGIDTHDTNRPDNDFKSFNSPLGREECRAPGETITIPHIGTSPMKVFCGRQMIDSTIFDPYRVDLRLGCKLLSIWSAKPRAYHS